MNADTQLTWLTPELLNKVRTIFEPRYGRNLTDAEIFDIAENLTGYFEIFLKQNVVKVGVKHGQ